MSAATCKGCYTPGSRCRKCIGAYHDGDFEIERVAIMFVDLSHQACRLLHRGEECRRAGKPSLAAAYVRASDALRDVYLLEAHSS